MALQQEQHAFRGMQRDLTVSKFSPEYFFDAKNIRITARENNTLLSITNEKGNIQMDTVAEDGSAVPIYGTLLGHAVIKNIIVLFTTEENGNKDHIYRLTFDSSVNSGRFKNKDLIDGRKIGFDILHPIEAIGIYENESIQKVYWVDGINQPRMINITDNFENSWSKSFDFSPEVELKDTMSVGALDSVNGVFSSGTIQYAFTYIYKYGTETPIINTSDLMYVSFVSRGSSPEDKVSMGFGITLNNLDSNFDYVRLYAVHRSSIDGPPSARRITDIAIPDSKSIYFVDTNTVGETIDATELLYKGGEDIIAGTISNKDNVLFLGDIKSEKKHIDESTKLSIRYNANVKFVPVKDWESVNLQGYYPYSNSLHLGAAKIKHFKRREWYRFGIQFQYKDAQWSEVVFLKDLKLEDALLSEESENEEWYYIASVSIPTSTFDSLRESGYRRARLTVVYPSSSDREVLCQGILCPTVFNVEDRFSGSIFAQSSWFARAFPAFASSEMDKCTWKLNSDDSPINSVSGVLSNRLFKCGDEIYNTVNQGVLPAFASHRRLYDADKRGGEIQCNLLPTGDNYISDAFTSLRKEELIEAVNNSKDIFMVDASILTLHSPDIEFGDSIQTFESDTLKLRIVGLVNLTSFASDIDIQTSTPAYGQQPQEGYGFYKEFVGVPNLNLHGGSARVNDVAWIDTFFGDKNDADDSFNVLGYFVYPWHANRSLMNQSVTNNDVTVKHAMLDKKKLSNIRFGGYNCLFKNAYEFEMPNSKYRTGISGVRIWNSNETGIIRVPAPKYSNLSDFNYSGNIDKIITCPLIDDTFEIIANTFYGRECAKNCTEGTPKGYLDPDPKKPRVRFEINKKDGYPLMISGSCQTCTDYHRVYTGDPVPMIPGTTMTDNWKGGINTTYNTHGTEPIRMKYKSTPHAVFALNYTNQGNRNLSTILPYTKYYNGNGYLANNAVWRSYTSGVHFFWSPKALDESTDIGDGTYQDEIPESSYFSNLYTNRTVPKKHGFSYLFLGELYRDEKDVKNRFGGNSEEAYQNNTWIPMPDRVDLDSTLAYTELKATVGDTFYQRYDCLKTYPFTLEDQNSIVDIVSFKVETRINLDGRYDRNRGQISNLVMTPENFNKLNPVYNQQNNFWTYRGLDTSLIVLDEFPNAVTWTNEKIPGGEIDSWTQINLASILYLSGEKGKVTSLNTYKNELYAFQENGFSHLLYNARVQIPASDGVPIEISNGTKMGGKIYISETVGCVNKWSIVESETGIYFIDNNTNGIYLFNGQLNNLSDKLGFRQWIGENNSIKVWDPLYWNNFKTYYDYNNGDVYFTNKDTSLCFSENLGQFTSFMDYGRVPSMINIEDSLFSFENVSKGNSEVKVWKQFAGDYNMFFGKPKPYYVTFVSNANFTTDKIFNILEFRADNWSNGALVERTFDTLEVWNEYQKGMVKLTNRPGFPSPLKRKFRIWRALIPRDTKNQRDRIRNTWAYIKLGKEDVSTNRDRVELHDATVHYFA